jgi:NADPH:quinone reductase-like Zn-dependent oxidoreductase
MKAIFLSAEKKDIIFTERPKPTPKAGEALVKVVAAALNHRDQWIRVALYPGMTYDCILGSDACGVVEAVGDARHEEWLGKAVVINPNQNWGENPEYQSERYTILGMPTDGTLAEYVCVPIDRLHVKPAHLSYEEAAALPLAGLTAYRAVRRKGGIQKGQRVLVTGIGGGVAQLACQFALALGAEVYVTSSSDAKIQKMKELGVAGGVNYKQDGWHKELLKETGGFDVIIDSAGGDGFNLLLKTMKPAATLVFYGATLGSPSKLDMPRIFFGQYTIKGTTMGNDQEFEEMLRFVEAHKLRPIIDSVRPLAEGVAAFNDMRDGKIFGKIVLKP